MDFTPPYKPNTWRAIAVAVGLLIVIGLVLFLSQKCGTWNFNRGMKQANANLANAINGLANIQDQKAAKEKELQQLNEQEAGQKQVVADAAKDAEQAAAAERDAQIAANQAASNVNAVNAADFNGTTLANAQRARCLAFPYVPECQ
jgi:uncharacterized protein (DUF2164 family)